MPNLPIFIKFRSSWVPWQDETQAKILKEDDKALYVGLKMLAIGLDHPNLQTINA